MKSMITVCNVNSITKSERFEYRGLLSDWIMSKYEKFDIPTKIYSGGLNERFLIAEFDGESEPDHEEFLRLNMHHDNVFIVQSPLGLTTAFFITLAQNIAISAAISLVVAALTPSPDLPVGTRQAKGSPNNNVGPQQNVARPDDRVPDVYGEDRCTPDLITSGTTEFINHLKYITQDFCVSLGYGEIEDTKSGETPLTSIAGAILDIYPPFTNAPLVLKERISNDVKQITLNSPNDAGQKLSAGNSLYYESIPDEGTITSRIDEFDNFTMGSSAVLSDVFYDNQSTVDGAYVVGSDFQFLDNLNGTSFSYIALTNEMTITDDYTALIGKKYAYLKRVINLGAPSFELRTTIYFTEIISASALEVVIKIQFGTSDIPAATFSDDSELSIYELTFSDASDSSAYWDLLVDAEPVLEVGSRTYDPRIQSPDEIVERGPFVVAGDENSEVWLDIQFPRGLVRDTDKSVTVDTRFFFEQIDSAGDPTGYNFNYNASFTDNDIDPRFYTRKVTVADGLIVNTEFRVTGERLSNSDPGDQSRQDQCQWTRLAGIENITAPDTTGTTRLQVRTQATEQTSSLQQSQINLQWTRKCLTYNGVNVIGDLSTGVGLIASRKMADNFITYSFNPLNANRNESNIDLDELYAIQDDLDQVFSGEKGEFGFTFANQNEPVINEMRIIADACRCFLTQSGSVISMVRDEIQPLPKQIFNRRNKLPNSDRKSFVGHLPLDFDGIEMEYKDREDDETRIIRLPDDLEAGDPNFGNTASNYQRANAVGMRNRSQAWDRAQYQYNRLIYKRVLFETGVTEEGLLLDLNDRIEVVDGTRPVKGSDGEVLGISGLTVDSSEQFIPDPSKTYSVIFRNEDGTVSNAIPVTARADTIYGFTLSSSYQLYLRGQSSYQLGSLYNIGEDGDETRSYLVQSRSSNNFSEVALELINYDPRYYQGDTSIAPTV